MTQRLRRQQRLLTAADYRRVFQRSERRAGSDELLLLARSSDLPRHRLGLAVARKHAPRAVQRNLIKRLAREQFRHLAPTQPALDIVILSRPAARDANREQLARVIKRLFHRLGLERSET